MPPDQPELRLLHRWLDTWAGIGDVVAGMAREEYDLELRRYNGRGWRAIFFVSGFEHSLTSHAGSALARRPVGGSSRVTIGAAEDSAQDTEGDDGFPPQAPR